ncbi:MAG: SCP2 sterol-binding domain-containing protein [Candidatus Hodarchaeota archaeon]
MANKEDVKAAIEAVTKKFDDEKISSDFKTFNRSLIFDPSDLDIDFKITLQDGKVQSLEEGNFEGATDITIIADSDTLVGVLDGSIKAMQAFTKQKLKVKNAKTPEMMKLMKIVG